MRRVVTTVGPLIPPVLFAAYPLLPLFEENQSELPLSVIWSPLAVVAACAIALYVALFPIFRSGPKAGALTSLAVVTFFYWSTFKSDLSGLHLADGWLIALWLGLFAAAAILLVRTKRPLVNLTLALAIAPTVMTVAPAVRIARYQHRHPLLSATDPRLWPTALAQPSPPAGSARPDIYVLVPDDYARTDVLKRYFHYDNGGFIRQLEKRGFVISERSRSPYSDSESNIAAELNLDYLSELPKILGTHSQDVRPVKEIMENNRAARLLKPLGYRFVHLDSDEVTFAGGNPHISSVATPDSFTSLWLRKSVLRLVGGRFGFNDAAGDERFRQAVRSTFSQLAAVPEERGPKFVVFHTLLPHDPYVFGAHGQPVSYSHADEDLGSPRGMRVYLQQLRYTSRKLLEAVDAIQAKSARPPVIVIEADEGFQANDQPLGEDAMRQIRVKGLVALSLPGAGHVRAPDPPNTVNTLRLVFNRYFGTRYPMLRSASYPEGDYPYQFEEMRVR